MRKDETLLKGAHAGLIMLELQNRRAVKTSGALPSPERSASWRVIFLAPAPAQTGLQSRARRGWGGVGGWGGLTLPAPAPGVQGEPAVKPQ